MLAILLSGCLCESIVAVASNATATRRCANICYSAVRCPYLRLMQSMEFVVKGVCWSIADICRENCFFKRNEKDLREILNS